jgi:formylmethanofuran dehydrogenase subunit E
MRFPTTISSHPRTVQTYRDNTASSSMATVRLHVYRCKRCARPVYQTAGRKKCANGGWICPACVEKQKGK